MRKRKIVNLCMVFAIAIVLLGGIVAVGAIKGWFRNEATSVVVLSKNGIAMIERSGVSYEVEESIPLRQKDHLTTVAASKLTVGYENIPGLFMDSETSLIMNSVKASIGWTLDQGDIVLDGRKWPGIEMSLNFINVALDKAVVAFSVKPGADMVYVLSGEVVISDSEGANTQTFSKGQVITAVAGEKQWNVESLAIHSLKSFVIETLMDCEIDDTFCVTSEELKSVLTERLAQKMAGETLSEGESVKYCTIEIVCHTILDNMDKLSKGKEGYVPDNGVILDKISVAYVDGESVFDVLERVCTSAEIPLEFSYTPIYESYYIEGINHIYEFDCGFESGWMYKVNDWFPNYGCSSYKVEEGDSIVWCYTCTGLGNDVGAQRME